MFGQERFIGLNGVWTFVCANAFRDAMAGD